MDCNSCVERETVKMPVQYPNRRSKKKKKSWLTNETNTTTTTTMQPEPPPTTYPTANNASPRHPNNSSPNHTSYQSQSQSSPSTNSILSPAKHQPPSIPSTPSYSDNNYNTNYTNTATTTTTTTLAVREHNPTNPMTLFLLGQNDPHVKHHIEIWLGLKNQADIIHDMSSRSVDGSNEDEEFPLGEEVTIKLTGAVFNKKSHIKLWWVEGRPVSGVIEVGQWPQDPRPIYCTAYISRRGEAYSRVPFMLGLETRKDGGKKVVVNEIGLPFWPRALHRDSDVPCTQGYDDEPMKKWETIPKGRYAILIACDGNRTDDGGNGNRTERGRVSDARQLERVLRARGYSIVRFYGNSVDASVVQHVLKHVLRPPEPPRQMGRGGWWAGGSRSAEVFAFVSVPFSMEFQTLRSDIMIGGRCARPYYLQGYTQPISNRRDMLTSRILLAVDNLIVPSDIDFIKGSCTNIQVGAQNIIQEQDGGNVTCVPMQCGQNVSVQCLSMPYYLTNSTQSSTQNSTQNSTQSTHSTSDNGSSICSMFVRCILQSMSGNKRLLKNKVTKDYISTSDLCSAIEKLTRDAVQNNGVGYLRETCAPRLLHVYPGPVVHPDVSNINLQLWFRRTKKEQHKVHKERQKIRKEVQKRQILTAQRKKEDHSMSMQHALQSMHGVMLKSKIDAIKKDMKSSPKTGRFPGRRRRRKQKTQCISNASVKTIKIYTNQSGSRSPTTAPVTSPSRLFLEGQGEDDESYSSTSSLSSATSSRKN